MPVKKKTNKNIKKNVSKKSSNVSVKNSKKSFPVSGIIGLIILVVAVVLGLIFSSKSDTGSEPEVVFDLYAMSQCPYGVQAETEAIKAAQRFDGAVDLNVYFIVQSVGDVFQSLHGQPEVDENMRQVCIQELYPDLFQEYLLCFAPGYTSAESQYAKCISEISLDSDSIFSCVRDKGVELLKASEAKSKEVGASASPTMYLNNEPYSGGRSELDFARSFCDLMDYEHEACVEIPKPVAVKVILLTDDNCPTCDTSSVVAAIKQLFPGAELKTVDVDTEEGQSLVEDYSLTYLPAYIFDSKLLETNTWNTNEQIKGSFVESKEGFRIRDEAVGATWFIYEQKQAEFFESIGVTKGDNRPQIDFFVMSYCPYGNMAEEAIEPAYQVLKEEADFNPKYVIYSNYGSGYPDYCLDENSVLCSMHGIQELNQNIREACVAKYYGMDEWFSFALAMNSKCNSGNADTCWQAVAESLSLDVGTISTCEQEEGYDLMLADKELGDKLGARGSPSVFVEGAQYNGARTANGYLSALCTAFDEAPADCNEVISEPEQAAVPQGSC
ncbi:MAG: hypothetical protein KKF65_05965 [Nanoarchaeota archaeon]|nr:hypothetical protein [Nanoarchaeota archaeon]